MIPACSKHSVYREEQKKKKKKKNRARKREGAIRILHSFFFKLEFTVFALV